MELEMEDEPENGKSSLSDKQRARSERNRQRAILLRNARLASHPYLNKNTKNGNEEHSTVQSTRLVDSGGGFLLDTEEDLEAQREMKVVFEPGPELSAESENCDECGRPFQESYLFKNFSVFVCDNCRDDADKHALITKTDAKTEYLLKDCDLDLREPPLKCIVKKNPHRSHWGEMKLYLKSQVASRSLEVWKSVEGIEEEKERRANAKDMKKQKKFDRKVKGRNLKFPKNFVGLSGPVHGNETCHSISTIFPPLVRKEAKSIMNNLILGQRRVKFVDTKYLTRKCNLI